MGKIFDAINKAEKKHGVRSPEALDSLDLGRQRSSRPGVGPDASVLHGRRPAANALQDMTPRGNRQEAGPKPSRPDAPEAGPSATVSRHGVSTLESEPLVGSGKFHRNLIMIHKPGSAEAERFRMLRSNLMFSGPGQSPRSILVTSAVPGEGKSFVASNLAISVAQCVDKHVLLVDCDIRKPVIHSRFGFGDAPGLSEYHLENRPLSEMLLKPGVGNLTILPGGGPALNPSELLSSERMSKLLEELKSRYDDRVIIIDSPPPMLTSEAKALAGQVDGVIMVVRSRSTPRKLVEDTVEIMGKEKILGVILNRANAFASGYGHGGKTYYGKNVRGYYQK